MNIHLFNPNQSRRPRFLPGRICITEAAEKALEADGTDPASLLERHLSGDWGDVSQNDRDFNELAVIECNAIISNYRLNSGVVVWVFTDDARSYTVIHLPEDQ